jgi:hypothetical protein
MRLCRKAVSMKNTEDWYRVVAKEKERRDENIEDWFRVIAKEKERRNDNIKWLNLKEGENFQLYLSEFLLLSKRLEKSEEDKLDIFLLGLNSNTRMFVKLRECESFLEAVKVATIVSVDIAKIDEK